MAVAATVSLQFSSGRGPAECRMAVAGISLRCMEEAATAGLRAVETARVAGEHGPFSVVLAITGEQAASFAAKWTGTLLWLCQSPLRGKDARKRWFIGCARVAQPGEAPAAINPADLTWTTMKASGPGGQHVNKTESAVRLVHRPTGLSVTSSEERSQHRNRDKALAKLAAILAGQAQAQGAQDREHNWTEHDALERGRPTRTFEGQRFR